MNTEIIDIYRGGTLKVTAQIQMCASFSFDVTSPTGYTQHVSMGGENKQRAAERAREMIDMEIAMAVED